ncbi:MAG: nucleotidyltransferase family protein [Solirubrobacteraceae bacterium]
MATTRDGDPLTSIAGLVLAAGGGARFGAEPKQLADLRGRPLLEWAVSAQCAVSALERVVVVLGSHAAEIVERVRFDRAETVVCSEWATGQAASLRCGLRELATAAKVIVTLGDAPLVIPEVIARFVAQPPRTRASYAGRPGHPVVLGPEQISALMSHRGDEGARDLLRGGPVIEVGDLCSGRDVDTPDDLEEVRNEARAVI